MIKKATKKISPKISLFSAFIIHGCVEIPFFIFPVIVILVGKDLFPNLGTFSWIGLGSLGTIGTLAAALPSPLFGRLADKYRRGAMMLASLLLAILGSFSIGVFGKSFIVMLFGVILLGLGLSLYHPLGLSWITTAFEDEKTRTYSSKYVRILALHGVGGTLGASIGPLSVFFLINTIEWRQIYFFWSFPLTIVALGFWALVARHESRIEPFNILDTSANEQKSTKWDFSMILFLIFAFITMLSLTRGMMNFILSPFLSEVKGFEIATAALFIGLSTLVGAFGEILGGFIGDKYGERVVLSSFALIQIAILILIFNVETKIILFVLYILLGITSAFFWPSTNSLVAKNSARRGVAFGRVMLVAHFFGALGPSIDGILLVIDPNQYLMIFTIACICSMAGFLFLLFLGRIFNNNSNLLSSEVQHR